MKTIGLVTLGVTLLVVAFGISFIAAAWPRSNPAEGPADERQQRRLQAAEVLEAGLSESEDVGLPDAARLEACLAACRRAIEILGTDTQASAALARATRAASQATASAETSLGSLRETMQGVGADLAFTPIIEADLPRGFPRPTPVGEIEVKQYPAYRMAWTESGGAAFWPLFRHIKREEIAMTAPVQMDYRESETGPPTERSMAFLYGEPDWGEAGSDGAVRVDDVAPMTAVSLGLRGQRTRESLRNARSRLTEWLAANSARYERACELRVMGYNSPFVPAARRYYEVQIPVVAMESVAEGGQRPPFELRDYLWKNRVVLAFAPSRDDATFSRFREAWRDRNRGVSDRDLVLVEIFEQGESRAHGERLSGQDASTLRERFAPRPERSTFVLVGKDGGEKLRRSSVELPEIFAAIDAMPMRRAEIARERAG